MPKQKKLTPKELYWAKKNREEQERAAYPPPGLVNHGNTCFMNSVLQGFFATDLLRRMVEFQSQSQDGGSGGSLDGIPSPSRSPLLTNGRGPQDVQQEWCEGLSVGDIFIRTLERAWTMRDKKDRASMSPKELLAALGKKYDQYLDFRQQDAHEFFIHLLDAMRMEEIDIIKKRQPPLPKGPAHNRLNNTNIPTGKHSPLQLIPEEERLMPFVDMIWGGRFTSYLICTTCKHVSHTYEDFDGLSLPIRHDESKERKRDRLRAFASKFMAASGGQWHNGLLLPRAQSQPPSPPLTSRTTEQKLELGDIPESTRRRSFESTVGSLSISNMGDEIPDQAIGEDDSLNVEKAKEKILEEISNVAAPILSSSITEPASGFSTPDLSDVPDKLAAAADTTTTTTPSSVPSSASASTRTLPVVSPVASGTQWSKKVGGRISRRISITMKGGKLGERMKTKDKTEKSDSEAGGVTAALEKLSGKSTPVPEDATTEAGTSRLQSNSASSTSDLKHTKTKRRSALLLHNRLREREPRQKTKVPASDREALEATYLTRILQDTPATYPAPLQLLTGPAGSSESLARASSTSSSGSGSGSGMQALMAQLSRLNIGGASQSIEECLRTFTAVEALDGENMFGCHMCWNIAHGKVSTRRRASGDDSSNDEEERKNDTPLDKSPISPAVPRPPLMLSKTGRTDTSSSIGSVSSVQSTSTISSKSTVFAQWTPDIGSSIQESNEVDATSDNKELGEDSTVQSTDSQAPSSSRVKTRTPSEDTSNTSSNTTADSSSVKSDMALTICTTPGSAVDNKGSETTTLGFGSPEIPTIAMTMSSPVSPEAKGGHEKDRGITITMLNGVVPNEKDVLRPPRPSFRRGQSSKDGFSSESSMTSASEDEQGEISGISDASSAPPFVGPVSGLNGSNSPRRSRSTTIPRSKQVIYRRALKRYLISDPPPILVIHLKRFQQVSKSSLTLFGNFKKLDDYVSFPEYLNLQPFLAPRKEDYGLGRGEMEGRVAEKGTRMEDKSCIFRLYAVIVHIGNLLGGHYVAYTALPPNDPILHVSPDSEKDKDKDKSKATESGKRNETQSSQPKSRQWCYISDTEVRLVSLEEVLKAKAYLCMYERIVD